MSPNSVAELGKRGQGWVRAGVYTSPAGSDLGYVGSKAVTRPATNTGIGCRGPETGASPGPAHHGQCYSGVQLRHDTDGRRYFRRKLTAGKTPMEAMRCLKRRLSVWSTGR
jgi:hypothetical protein